MELDNPAGRDQRFFMQSGNVSGTAWTFLQHKTSQVKYSKFFIFGKRFPENPGCVLKQVCRLFPAHMKLFSKRTYEFIRIQGTEC